MFPHPKHIFLAIILTIQTPTSLSFAPPQLSTHSTALFSTNGNGEQLKIAIVGAGPSALLLTHRLISSPKPPPCSIDIYESRSDPRKSNLQDRAYALGLGIRGRTAIKSVNNDLWEAVKQRGYECDRFRLYINPSFNVKLRDREEGVQPSVLIYQSDLCGALLDELEKRDVHNKVNLRFDANVNQVDLSSSQISIDNRPVEAIYDLIIGCDGANSIVRKSLEEYSPPFCAETRQLPGYFKVARVEQMPPKMDPSSVALLLPKSGRVTAFVEPTVGGGGCILFAGRLNKDSSSSEEEVDLAAALFGSSSTNTTHLHQMIQTAFPLLEDTPSLLSACETLLSSRNGIATSVKCNIYHSSPSSTPAVLVGDAAHATGGVSGQGCNSALVDSKVLADSLENYSSLSGDTSAKLHECLRQYSSSQVLEGWALYDLSFGNDGKTLPILRNINSILSNAIDAIFGGKFGIGKKPLQTLLASSDAPFVDIRREREKYFLEEFGSDDIWRERLDVYE